VFFISLALPLSSLWSTGPVEPKAPQKNKKGKKQQAAPVFTKKENVTLAQRI
jgi:hypothetical protein